MSSEKLKLTRLGAILNFSNGRTSPVRTDESNIPVYGSNGLIGYTNESNSLAETIVIGRVGSYCGAVHFSDVPCWITDNAIKATTKENHDARFMYYLLKQINLNNWRSGSGQPLINQSTLNNIEVTIPEPVQQKKIGDLISQYDIRIALLHETNKTLESIAQALFKSWFIDFDPVRAKAEGRLPEGMDEATAALFPDSFEESELGEIPEGWRVVSFRDSVDVIGGGTPKTSVAEYWDGSIPWFSVVDAPSASDVFVIDTEKHITEAGLNGSSTKLLPVGTTIISARGTVGRLALTGCSMAMNQSCYGLRGKADDQYFTYFSTTHLVEQLKQRAHGSVFDTITQETLAGVSLVYPSADVISSFEKFVNPIMMRIKENLLTASSLVKMRDTLLPRLISGQLQLPEAQAKTEALTA